MPASSYVGGCPSRRVADSPMTERCRSAVEPGRRERALFRLRLRYTSEAVDPARPARVTFHYLPLLEEGGGAFPCPSRQRLQPRLARLATSTAAIGRLLSFLLFARSRAIPGRLCDAQRSRTYLFAAPARPRFYLFACPFLPFCVSRRKNVADPGNFSMP